MLRTALAVAVAAIGLATVAAVAVTLTVTLDLLEQQRRAAEYAEDRQAEVVGELDGIADRLDGLGDRLEADQRARAVFRDQFAAAAQALLDAAGVEGTPFDERPPPILPPSPPARTEPEPRPRASPQETAVPRVPASQSRASASSVPDTGPGRGGGKGRRHAPGQQRNYEPKGRCR